MKGNLKMIIAAIVAFIVVMFAKSALSKEITLTENNHVYLNGKVTGSSVDKLIKEVKDLHFKLEKDKPIYLVLDTPGGSILDGWRFIQFVKSLDRKVHTISIYAASMGFQFVQAFDRRYITKYSVLMAHHGSTSCSGTIKDIIACATILKKVDEIENNMAAKRIGISPKSWSKYIEIDRYFIGDDYKTIPVADEVVNLKCSKSLMNKKIKTQVRSFFGSITSERSACPLM